MKKPFRGDTVHAGARNLSHVILAWEARGEEEEALRTHLESPPKGITVITAPKGAGKTTLVNSVLHGRDNVIKVDFGVVDAIPDSDFIDRILSLY